VINRSSENGIAPAFSCFSFHYCEHLASPELHQAHLEGTSGFEPSAPASAAKNRAENDENAADDVEGVVVENQPPVTLSMLLTLLLPSAPAREEELLLWARRWPWRSRASVVLLMVF
jgi:hypothetical protein